MAQFASELPQTVASAPDTSPASAVPPAVPMLQRERLTAQPPAPTQPPEAANDLPPVSLQTTVGRMGLRGVFESRVRATTEPGAEPAEPQPAEAAQPPQADEPALPADDGGNKQPPPPGEPPVPSDGPEDNGEYEEPEWRRQLAADTVRDPASTVDFIFPTDTHNVAVNLAHPKPELVDRAVEELGGGLPEEWPKLPGGKLGRTYHHDPLPEGDEEATPSIFVKVKPEVLPAELATI